MNINNAIYTSLKHYPNLFLRSDYEFTRFAVLAHVFLCSGGDYDWMLTPNGWAKVEIFQDPPDESGDPHAMYLNALKAYSKNDYGFEESVSFLRELERQHGIVLVMPEQKERHIALCVRLLQNSVDFSLEDLDAILEIPVQYRRNYNNRSQIDTKNIDPECKAGLVELLDYLMIHSSHLEYNIRKDHLDKEDSEIQHLVSLYQNKVRDLKNLLLV